MSWFKSRAQPVTDSDDNLKRRIKIMTIGDEGVGKRSLLISYTKGSLKSGGTLWEETVDKAKINDGIYDLMLLNSTGLDAYDRLRPLYYPKTQCFMLCFSVVNRTSFENISKKWIPEVKHYCPVVPFLLVGTQVDLRDAARSDHISCKEGKVLERQIGAKAYVECSALMRETLEEVIRRAVMAASSESRSCTLL